MDMAGKSRSTTTSRARAGSTRGQTPAARSRSATPRATAAPRGRTTPVRRPVKRASDTAPLAVISRGIGSSWTMLARGVGATTRTLSRAGELDHGHRRERPAAFGPEILVGDLPADIRGTSRLRRGGAVIWEKPFLSGEANMSHSFANLEHHHFKYDLFRQPGDLHVHMFGTATLSFADGVKTEAGDVFEIEAAPFGLPLTNPLAFAPKETGAQAVTAL